MFIYLVTAVVLFIWGLLVAKMVVSALAKNLYRDIQTRARYHTQSSYIVQWRERRFGIWSFWFNVHKKNRGDELIYFSEFNDAKETASNLASPLKLKEHVEDSIKNNPVRATEISKKFTPKDGMIKDIIA